MIKRKLLFGVASLAAGVILSISSIASALTVDYTTVANGVYPSIVLGGTTVTGSSNVKSASYVGYRGLGIVGGGSDLSLDLGETMKIDFGRLVSNVHLTLVDIVGVGNVTFSFEAFNGSASLGSFSFPTATVAPQTYDVSALAGDLDMTSFAISVFEPSAPIGLQIQGVSYEAATSAVPEPASMLLLGLGLAGVAVARKKLQK